VTKNITYYAIMDDDAGGHDARTVLRRRETDAGEVDEVFSRDLKWEFSSLMYSNERGDTSFFFRRVCEDQANKIVESVCDEAAALVGHAADRQSLSLAAVRVAALGSLATSRG
jgi:hypothetical protein